MSESDPSLLLAHVRAIAPAEMIAGRIGGEEFCIVLMDKAPDEALAVAEAVRESVERIGACRKAGDRTR